MEKDLLPFIEQSFRSSRLVEVRCLEEEKQQEA